MVVRNAEDKQGLRVTLTSNRIPHEETEVVVEDRSPGWARLGDGRRPASACRGNDERQQHRNDDARMHCRSHDPINAPIRDALRIVSGMRQIKRLRVNLIRRFDELRCARYEYEL